MQQHLFNHFCTSGNCGFLEHVSLTFIGKSNPSDLLKRKDYWRSRLKAVARFGLNVEESILQFYLQYLEVLFFYRTGTFWGQRFLDISIITGVFLFLKMLLICCYFCYYLFFFCYYCYYHHYCCCFYDCHYYLYFYLFLFLLLLSLLLSSLLFLLSLLWILLLLLSLLLYVICIVIIILLFS